MINNSRFRLSTWMLSLMALLIGLVVGAAVGNLGLIEFSSSGNASAPEYSIIQPSFTIDIHDDKQLLEFADVAAVVAVNENLGTVERDGILYTRYSAVVSIPIMGDVDVNDDIIVNQLGGLVEDGERLFVSVSDSDTILVPGTRFFVAGKYLNNDELNLVPRAISTSAMGSKAEAQMVRDLIDLVP